jgi:hypothetical protein
MFFVYVLYSKSFDKIYVGFTSDLENRLNLTMNYPKKVGLYDFGHGKLFILKNFRLSGKPWQEKNN